MARIIRDFATRNGFDSKSIVIVENAVEAITALSTLSKTGAHGSLIANLGRNRYGLHLALLARSIHIVNRVQLITGGNIVEIPREHSSNVRIAQTGATTDMAGWVAEIINWLLEEKETAE